MAANTGQCVRWASVVWESRGGHDLGGVSKMATVGRLALIDRIMTMMRMR